MSTAIEITKGAPVLQIFKKRIFFKPELVIYNLSVYRNQILRNMTTRTIMFGSKIKHVIHLHGGEFSEIGISENRLWKLLNI
ncbi:hypothetical protein N9C84_02835, partial [Desulfobacterales bacterium]|nr:hypothetical protein [Desulfobacterales bacterium]